MSLRPGGVHTLRSRRAPGRSLQSRTALVRLVTAHAAPTVLLDMMPLRSDTSCPQLRRLPSSGCAVQVLAAQLNVRMRLERASRGWVSIVAEKMAYGSQTRFEDFTQLPVGISVNFTSFSSKMLAFLAHYPKLLVPYFSIGDTADVEVRLLLLPAVHGMRVIGGDTCSQHIAPRSPAAQSPDCPLSEAGMPPCKHSCRAHRDRRVSACVAAAPAEVCTPATALRRPRASGQTTWSWVQ